MTYSTPERRARSVQQVLEALEAATSIVLTTHLNADGDGVGCQAALMAFLHKRGKEVWIVNPTPLPDRFRVLLDEPEQVLAAGSEKALRRCQAADVCVVVDTGEVPRIGRVNPMVEGIPKIVIDHHPPGERAIPGLALRDATAAAAGELVFDLLLASGTDWSRSMVDGIYTAIMTDTGSFRFSNTTAGVHRIVAELIERGALPDELYQRIYGSYPLRRFQLLKRALDTLTVAHDGQVAWMVVPREAYRELGCGPDDLEGMVDIPREVEGVEVAILFREMEDGPVKISFRSTGDVDVNALARTFGGGGHVKASGALVSGSIDEVVDKVVDRAAQLLPGSQVSSSSPSGNGEPKGEEART